MFGAVGAIIGGFGKKKAAQAEEKASQLNAQQVRERVGIESTLRERAGAREAGSIAAAVGASGFTGVGGSAAEILRESARNREFDIASISKQGDLEAEAIELGGKSARRAGNIGLISSGISAASFLLGG